MIPQNPQVTRLGRGLVGWLGDVVRIGQTRGLFGIEYGDELTGGQVLEQGLHGLTLRLHSLQEGLQGFVVRLGQRGQRVERCQDLFFLLLGPGSDQDGDFLLAF